MMPYSEFIEYIKDNIHRFFPKEYEEQQVYIKDTLKNNNVVLKGLIYTSPHSNITPTIYLENFYDEYLNGKTLKDIMEKIASVYQENLIEGYFNTNSIQLYDLVKSKIVPKLIDSETNADYLKNHPHKLMDGLAIVYYIHFTEFNDIQAGSITASVTNELLEIWEKDSEEIHKLAVENMRRTMKPYFCTMKDIMLSLMIPEYSELSEDEKEAIRVWLDDKIPGDENNILYVLTNTERIYGASMLLNSDLMDDIEEKIGEFYILPSSVHEVIFVPKKAGLDRYELEEMVRTVNLSEVEIDEKLSNHVFVYDKNMKDIYRADHEDEHRKNVEKAASDAEEQAGILNKPHIRRGR